MIERNRFPPLGGVAAQAVLRGSVVKLLSVNIRVTPGACDRQRPEKAFTRHGRFFIMTFCTGDFSVYTRQRECCPRVVKPYSIPFFRPVAFRTFLLSYKFPRNFIAVDVLMAGNTVFAQGFKFPRTFFEMTIGAWDGKMAALEPKREPAVFFYAKEGRPEPLHRVAHSAISGLAVNRHELSVMIILMTIGTRGIFRF